MIRAMSEQDEAPASFFFPGAAGVEPVPAAGTDETASTTTAPAGPDTGAISGVPTAGPGADTAESGVPTAGPGADTAGPGADTAESFSAVNPDGSTTTQLPDGSFQTVVRLPGGATIVTSTQPPGASPTPAPADQPRGRRWRKRDR
jgi:hypothetical protein